MVPRVPGMNNVAGRRARAGTWPMLDEAQSEEFSLGHSVAYPTFLGWEGVSLSRQMGRLIGGSGWGYPEAKLLLLTLS